MTELTGPHAVDEYIASFPGATKTLLVQMRGLIRAAAPPEAVEIISYSMPTINLNGKHLVHFAGYEGHIGFYPIPTGIEAFQAELAPYKR